MRSEESDKLPSIRELKNICQRFYADPNGPLSEKFSKHTYHKITIYFSWLFLHTNITPNQMTLLSLMTGLVACFFLTQPGLYPVIAVILLNMVYIFDIIDGDIARYRKICSLNGAFFDRLTTAIIDPLSYLALTYAVYISTGSKASIIFGFSAAFSLLLFKTINGYLHLAVLEPIMHKKHAEMFTFDTSVQESSEGSQKAEAVVSTFFDYRSSSKLFKISEFLLGFGLYLSLYAVVIIDSFFDITFTFLATTLNFSYLFLIFTGVCLPIVCVVSAGYIIKNKVPELLYSRFFSSRNN